MKILVLYDNENAEILCATRTIEKAHEKRDEIVNEWLEDVFSVPSEESGLYREYHEKQVKKELLNQIGITTIELF